MSKDELERAVPQTLPTPMRPPPPAPLIKPRQGEETLPSVTWMKYQVKKYQKGFRRDLAVAILILATFVGSLVYAVLRAR